MKAKILSLLFALVAICTVTNAEMVTLSFSGETTEGRYCLLDSVHIENLTQNWVQTLDCSADTTFELPVTQMPTGIDNVSASNENNGLLSVSQNFIMGTTSLTINPLTDGVVHVRVIDMMGRIVIEHVEYLNAGYHQYTLQLGSAQTYMLSVITNTEHAATKILNLTSFGNFDLSRVSSIPAIYQAPARHQTSAEGGDLMQYTGYTNQKGVAVASEPVTQTQSSAERIVLRFAPVVKSTEGMYVSIMGFNIALYPYPFDILTSSNLYVHQQFVNDLNMANGTILYHAVYTALDNVVKAPVPEKLQNVSIVTFTDGLDVNSWRMNSTYPSEPLYLAAVNKQIHRTCIDGVKLDAYAIGVKGSDVMDVVRFDNDLHQLASDSANVFSVSNMEEVNARFREIAAKIYNTNVNYSLSIKLAAPEPGSIIRFTFDNVNDASNSIYYIEGTYDFDWGSYVGSLNNVVYSGIMCSNGDTWTATPDGLFDIFTIYNLSSNLGERISTTNMKQWIYVPSSNMWQINSEFDASSSAETSEERTSAIVALVLDCSSSLGDYGFSKLKSAANNFLNILTGNGDISKPSVSIASYKLGDLQATLSASITNTGNLQIIDKGFCVSEKPNMDDAVFYSCGTGEDNFEYLLTNLIEGKAYYVRPYAENQLGRTYGGNVSFTAVEASIPIVVTNDISDITTYSALCSGNVTFDGYSEVTECGFCWSTTPNPTITDSVLTLGSAMGAFNGTIGNLEDDTTYYVRAYAKNSKGIGYGNELSFTTIAIVEPEVSLLGINTVSYNRANGNGEVTFDGNSPIIECGFCWSTNPMPTLEDSIVSVSFETAEFSGELQLEANITYYVRAYAKNKKKIAYSQEIVPTCISVIFYTAEEKLVEATSYEPDGIDPSAFGTPIVSHDFEDGIGAITFKSKITKIGNSAFNRCQSMTSITMPNYITTIGANAFKNCSSLAAVVFPDSLTTIGEYAFSGCTSLTSLNIPNRVSSIGNNAFCICSNLTSVNIPDSLTFIAWAAFYNCPNLTSIEIPHGITSIAGNAFQQCPGLTSVIWNARHCEDFTYYNDYSFGNLPFSTSVTSFTISEGVTNIPAYLCYNMKKLDSINIPNSVTSIGQKAFYNCSSLKSVTISSHVTTIGNNAFYKCDSLTLVDISSNPIVSQTYTASSNLSSLFGKQVKEYILGEGIFTIGDYAFYKNDSLTSITIPSTLTNIGESAFSFCRRLVSANIPEGVTTIGNSVFENCDGLKSIYFPNSIVNYGSYIFSGCTSLLSVTLNHNTIVSGTYTSSSSISSIFGKQVEEYILGNNITSIGKYAFSHCDSIKYITIPNNVTCIGDYAFHYCTNLSSVILPNNITSIGEYAFYYCKKLTSVTIPNSVTSIGQNAFFGCQNMSSLTISQNITSIERYTFANCTSLKSVEIPNSVTSIGEKAFYYCTSLDSIVIGSNIANIGSNAFLDCGNNATVEINSNAIINKSYNSSTNLSTFFGKQVKMFIIGDSVTGIGNYAFYQFSGMESVSIPNSVTSIGSDAFYGCSGLTSISLPRNITKIGHYVFANCSSLTSISIPNSVTSIDSYAFYNCKKLKFLSIGNNVKTIGDVAFGFCKELISITCKTETPPTNGGQNVFVDVNKSIPLYVPASSVSKYNGWNGFTNILPITEYDSIAFGSCGVDGENLTWLLMDNNVLTISGTGDMLDWTYSEPAPWSEYKSSITSIILPDGLTHIGNFAFRECNNLMSVTIPNSVISIGMEAFSYCSGLTSLHIGNNVTSIGNSAFTYCSNLTSLTIPNSVANIGTSAFLGCSGLTSIILASNVTTIGNSAFRDCSNLISIDIPSSVINIGGSALLGCTNLISVAIPNSVTNIEEWTFYGCSSLISLTIPNSVQYIGQSAFENCSTLASIIIGDNVSGIGSAAFANCSALNTITCKPTTPPGCGNNAFSSVNKSIPVFVPETSIEAYRSDEVWNEFLNLQAINE